MLKSKSTKPIYAIGITWVLCALFTEMNDISNLGSILVISLIVYAVGCFISLSIEKIKSVFYGLFPSMKPVVKEDIKLAKTGVAEADIVIEQGKKYIKELNSLNISIVDAKMSEQIDQMEQISKQIFKFIADNPGNTRQINRFMDYYFPEAIKLLTTYKDLATQRVKVQHMLETMGKIEAVMDSMVMAFKDQLDKLYQNKALDTKSDIDVLKNMLAQEGLDK